MSKTLTAEEWFEKNYHTPMDSFIGKYGIPVLHGVHDCGTEEWEDIPIHKVLEAYHKAKVESEIGKFCKAFFYWWYNQNGTNTEQGFDQWTKTDEFKKLLQQ